MDFCRCPDILRMYFLSHRHPRNDDSWRESAWTPSLWHSPLRQRHLDVVAGEQRAVGQLKFKHLPPGSLLLAVVPLLVLLLLVWPRRVGKNVVRSSLAGRLCENTFLTLGALVFVGVLSVLTALCLRFFLSDHFNCGRAAAAQSNWTLKRWSQCCHKGTKNTWLC